MHDEQKVKRQGTKKDKLLKGKRKREVDLRCNFRKTRQKLHDIC